MGAATERSCAMDIQKYMKIEGEKPESESRREALVEQLWEAKRGRAKGNKQKAEYRNREGTHGRPGGRERGKRKKRKRKTGTEEATERQKREERERKNRRLSSQNRNGRGRKKPEGKGKTRKRSESGKEGKHQWNSCGSETGKDERKQTGSRVREPGRKA